MKLSHNAVTGALELLGTHGSEPTKDGEEFWEAAVILLVACGFFAVWRHPAAITQNCR